jgi:hypothetical protein
MHLYTIHFWTRLVVLCSLEGGGRGPSWADFVNQVWHFLDLWCFQSNWEPGKNVESWRRHWSSGLQFRVGYNTVQNIFSQSEHIYSQLPSCLELTEVQFSQFRVNSCFERSTNPASLTAWPMLNVYHFKLGNEPLNPRFETIQPLHWIVG